MLIRVLLAVLGTVASAWASKKAYDAYQKTSSYSSDGGSGNKKHETKKKRERDERKHAHEYLAQTDIVEAHRKLEQLKESFDVFARSNSDTLMLSKRLVDVLLEVKPLINGIQNYESEIKHQEERRDHAEKYSEKLSAAGGSFERRQIHEACEKHLGLGQPGRIISEVNREITKKKDSINKLKKRLMRSIDGIFLYPKHAVIDGSNLLYCQVEGKSKMIGTKGLEQLIKMLNFSGITVHLFFDFSVYRVLKVGMDRLKEIFEDGLSVETLVISPIKEPADEYILKHADSLIKEEACNVIILSNDHFDDFPDYVSIMRNVVPIQLQKDKDGITISSPKLDNALRGILW